MTTVKACVWETSHCCLHWLCWKEPQPVRQCGIRTHNAKDLINNEELEGNLMQEKEGRGRSPVSQDPPAWDACFVLPPGPAATLAVGGLHFAGGHRLTLSRAFTFNCCSGLGGAAGFGPQAQCSVLAHLCSHQQGLTFHQVASGDVAARGSGAPRLGPGAQEPRVCVQRL